MKRTTNGKQAPKGGRNGARAFTLIEAVVSLPIAAIALTALYACFTEGFSVIGQEREDLRATQIMLKQLERIRVTPYNQLTNTTYNPQTLTDYFDPTDQSSGGGGATYTVSYSASVPAIGSLPEPYRTNMLLITIGLSWTNNNLAHSRSMQTYVAKNGMESYVSTGQ